jgi:hypothetical protein
MGEKVSNPEKKKRNWKKTAAVIGAVAVGAVVLF